MSTLDAEILKKMTGWLSLVVTGLSPFGPMFYDAFSTEDTHFVYSSEYRRNPVLEWNRQISVALKRLDESIKDAEDLPKSILRSLTRELVANVPALAAAADMRPFDSNAVKIVNVSRNDLKDVRVQFHGCTGYDSHTTFPDSFASPESPEQLRKSFDPVTITYRKINRKTPEGGYFQGYITFFGNDASQCRPVVFADLDTGRSAVGRRENIDDFIRKRYDDRQSWERWGDAIFKIGLLGFAVFVYLQVRSIRATLPRVGR